MLLSFGSCVFSRLFQAFISLYFCCKSITNQLTLGMQLYDSFGVFLLKIGLNGCPPGKIRLRFGGTVFPGLFSLYNLSFSIFSFFVRFLVEIKLRLALIKVKDTIKNASNKICKPANLSRSCLRKTLHKKSLLSDTC